MKKEDILEKSRQENQQYDERQKLELKKAGYMGGLAAMILSAIFAVVTLFRGESTYPFLAIVFAYFASIAFYSYFKVKKSRACLIEIIGWGLASSIYTAMYLLRA